MLSYGHQITIIKYRDKIGGSFQMISRFNTEDTFYVGVSQYALSSEKYPVLGMNYAATCTLLVVYNPQRHQALATHIPFLRTNENNNSIVALGRALDELLTDNTTPAIVYISGGRKKTSDSKITRQIIKEILLANRNVLITEFPRGAHSDYSHQSFSCTIDARNGLYSNAINMDDFKHALERETQGIKKQANGNLERIYATDNDIQQMLKMYKPLIRNAKLTPTPESKNVSVIVKDQKAENPTLSLPEVGAKSEALSQTVSPAAIRAFNEIAVTPLQGSSASPDGLFGSQQDATQETSKKTGNKNNSNSSKEELRNEVRLA